ncbi:MAG: iron ABC transporter substrate-binding protein [Rhodospirillales bacterium 70-18]|nr:MAG: iron ABC transporter substrate-binding protein [Rhodospirillales bacterium 70-18]
MLTGRRAILAAGAAALVLPAARARAAGPSSELIAAAVKEGTAVFHTSIDLTVAQKIVTAFQALYPGIRIQLERTGAERVLQRINQEYASNIYAADVVESSDATMFIGWKQQGWLAKFVPVDVGAFWPKEQRDADDRFASVRATLSVIAYNTKQVTAEEAPKGFLDLLSPKWRMRMVKAHPGYSGTILTSTFATEQALGWGYFEKVAKQRILQVQSASDPPKKVAQGERSIMFDGSEYVATYLKEAGNPIEIVYAVEGSPVIAGQMGVLEKAPHPNAARLFVDYVFSAPCQQMMADAGGIRSFHPEVKTKPGRKPLSEIKLLSSDPAALAKDGEEVKKRYTEIFGV